MFSKRRLPFPLGLALFACSCGRSPAPPSKPTSVSWGPAASCQGCHAEIAASFAKTGMARSFAAFGATHTTADFAHRNRFEHKASGRTYTMTLRDGAAYMRRHELDAAGRATNVVEKRIDYVMGSGLKAQTMIHRTPRGELVEMPVAWYTAGGGYWAMNPSYDRPDHSDFRRPIRYDCFFCHNAYPTGVSDDSFLADAIYPPQLPSGIDCQRCHGPGGAHVEAASGKAPVEKIRAAIVNPGKLDRQRQLDICYQCHLQSTSSPLPHVVTRLGRGVFSHRAGEALSDYALFFDHPAEAGLGDKFEIAHAAYRLRQSACFQASQMTCTTCHDPHKAAPAGSAACKKCHARPSGAMHASAGECLSCHMPQRRTEDVVEVVMTDHGIVRRAAAGLTARRSERHSAPYRGPVAPLHPAPGDALHTAVAQVRAAANAERGLPDLEKEVAARADCPAECYYELADAYGRAGRYDRAAAAAEQALKRSPGNPWILRAYGSLLASQGNHARAAELLGEARAKLPDDPATLHAIALNLHRQGKTADAVRLLEQVKVESAEVSFALGEMRHALGDAAGAEAGFRQALAAKPDYALAHFNVASILAGKGSPDALWHFQKAAQWSPADARLRYAYGIALASIGRLKQAAPELRAAAALDSANPRTQLALGMVLAELGERGEARRNLERAASATDAEVREQAAKVLAALR